MSPRRSHLPARRMGANAAWCLWEKWGAPEAPGASAWACGQEERAVPVPAVREELPAAPAVGEHTTSAQQPAGGILSVKVGWVVERTAFQKHGRQYLFLCK